MSRSDTSEYLAALRSVSAALNPFPSAIIGGAAMIASGVARFTADIDATVWGDELDLAVLSASFAKQSILPRIDDAGTFARSSRVLLLRHDPTGVPVDVSVAALPFEEEAIRLARQVDFSGVPIRVVRPEDLVIYKIVAARPQYQKDVENLMVLYRSSIDIARVRTIIKDFAALLDDPDRTALLESLWKRTAPGAI